MTTLTHSGIKRYIFGWNFPWEKGYRISSESAPPAQKQYKPGRSRVPHPWEARIDLEAPLSTLAQPTFTAREESLVSGQYMPPPFLRDPRSCSQHFPCTPNGSAPVANIRETYPIQWTILDRSSWTIPRYTPHINMGQQGCMRKASLLSRQEDSDGLSLFGDQDSLGHSRLTANIITSANRPGRVQKPSFLGEHVCACQFVRAY
ncbi:hypothetical protein K458DRAFT_143236 [Lentithecium fluviatile CBS 122367]|uniref:Uncharacterized protein n=1 Tax=Lentithecium fluviatile CBS 122367 TaxID=1168545 RepID=A0A6G1IJ67_9PLEO|nr:hypothetical protein K458DRAFT_143236 [Lentithecium fluviatile CBS 122367]